MHVSSLQNQNHLFTFMCVKPTTLKKEKKTKFFFKDLKFKRTDTEAEAPILWPPDTKN